MPVAQAQTTHAVYSLHCMQSIYNGCAAEATVVRIMSSAVVTVSSHVGQCYSFIYYEVGEWHQRI